MIGANGQVGAEVCLFLHVRGDVEVAPIARSPYTTSLLRKSGLACRHGSMASPDEARDLTRGCDVVADFSWPRSSPSQNREFIRTNVTNAVCCAPAESTHVFISTQSVYRLTAAEPLYRIYARSKLQAESLVVRRCRRMGRPVYVLRLGQVHGLLQSVSHDLMEDMHPGTASIPRMESFSVFAFTVAEALAHIALGREVPGTYTLTSVPPWTWRDVHLYYAERAKVTQDIVEVSIPAPAVPGLHPGAWLAPLWRLALRHREFLSDLSYRWHPAIAERARATYLKRRARDDVQRGAPEPWRPYLQERPVPGRRLTTLSDSRVTMHEDTRRVEELLATLV